LAHAKKANTRRVAALRVFILCLAALTPAVKPLANIVANYARCDSQQELAESTHFAHLPLLPGFSEKEGQYHKYTRIRRVSQERGLRIPTPVCALVRNDPPGGISGHCEERSDVAIRSPVLMTRRGDGRRETGRRGRRPLRTRTDLGVGPDAPIGPRPRPPKVRAHTEVRPYRHRRAWVHLRRGSFAWASVWLLRRRRLPHDLCVGPRPRPSSPAGSLRGAQRRGNPFSSGRRWKFIILGLHM
jgi:hypothetical protein